MRQLRLISSWWKFPLLSCLLHHIKRREKVSTGGAGVMFYWPLVYLFFHSFFTHPEMDFFFFSPALLFARHHPPQNPLPSSSSSSSLHHQHCGYKSVNTGFTPGITADRYYVVCPWFLRSEMMPASYRTIETDQLHLAGCGNFTSWWSFLFLFFNLQDCADHFFIVQTIWQKHRLIFNLLSWQQIKHDKQDWNLNKLKMMWINGKNPPQKCLGSKRNSFFC